jgi:hypothetical protein
MEQTLGSFHENTVRPTWSSSCPVLVKYGQTIGMEARIPRRVFRPHNVDLPQNPRSDYSRSDPGSSPETAAARAACSATTESRAAAEGSHIAERTKAKPGSSADAAGHTAASIP